MILADSDGVRYTCTVFRSFVVGPSDHHITFPLPDKNIVSLRTRTPRPRLRGEAGGASRAADTDLHSILVGAAHPGRECSFVFDKGMDRFAR